MPETWDRSPNEILEQIRQCDALRQRLVAQFDAHPETHRIESAQRSRPPVSHAELTVSLKGLVDKMEHIQTLRAARRAKATKLRLV